MTHSMETEINAQGSGHCVMLDRRRWLGVAMGGALIPVAAIARSGTSAEVRLNELGPENGALAQRIGIWEMTETVWESPGAAPVTTTGLIAERRMIGQMFQEILHPASDAAMKEIRRIDYLSFQRIEGRWKYVSMDMRAPVGIMNAASVERGENGTIDVVFAPFAIAGSGAESTGQLIGMTQTMTYSAVDRDVKDQYFILADGSGNKWLAHRYAYHRRA